MSIIRGKRRGAKGAGRSSGSSPGRGFSGRSTVLIVEFQRRGTSKPSKAGVNIYFTMAVNANDLLRCTCWIMRSTTTEGGKMIVTAIERRDLIAEIGGAPKVITSDAQHKRYVSALLELEGRERRGQLSAAGRSLAELLTVLVEKYEEEHHQIASASPVEVLREVMEANDLRQKDLTRELGTESVVSEVLSGKRKLNKDHIEKLSKRFHISPAVF